jgi:hypothetical protein
MKGGTVEVLDGTGRTVRTLHRETGRRSLAWALDDRNGVRLPAGIYFVRFVTGPTATVRKLVIAE